VSGGSEASVDQLIALLPGQVDAIELLAVEREAGDRQRLALRAGFLYPMVCAT
jgi:hypothetical protein